MFTDSEKIVVYLSPYVLGINLNMILLQSNEKEIVQKYNYYGKSNLNIEDNIFILNRKKHFETIFTYNDNQKFNFVYCYYRNNLPPTFINLNYSSNNNNQNSAKEKNIRP